MQVLIADDQKRTRQSLRLLLKTLPYNLEISEAANGQEALEFSAAVQPRVVVMDARMPGMDGLEATRLIKDKWPNVKVIVLSMYPEYQEAAAQAGADAFVSKGEPVEKLLDTVDDLLEESSKP